MAQSIRLVKLFHTGQLKNFHFLFLTTFNGYFKLTLNLCDSKKSVLSSLRSNCSIFNTYSMKQPVYTILKP